MVMLIFSQRDYGSMLIAERKTEIYQRKDGGDGKNASTSEGEGHKLNAVEEDTPKRWWNLVVPVLVLVRNFHMSCCPRPFFLVDT
jgi:hypothetical protein